MILIKNALLYTPAPLGRKDILVAGDTIVVIEDHIDEHGFPVPVAVIDAAGLAVVPGFIDGHVHITGGGGEGSFKTRTPELVLSAATSAGVTTVVGVLGTDGICRSVEALIAKTYALREEGISAWCYTGSYRLPPVTVTGDVMKDIMLIEPVLGVGEVAISDHRSSRPSDAELANVTAQARVAGMLSGKAGVVNVHLGDAPDGLGPLERIVAAGDIPITQFLPTHCNRNPVLFEQALRWAKTGGWIDFTASTVPAFLADGETSAAAAFQRLKTDGIPLSRATVTSDGQGSLPSFNEEGVMTGLDIGSCSSLLAFLTEAVQTLGMALEEALLPITANPALALGLARKGRLAPGMSADILILTADLKPSLVLARGRVMVRNGSCVVKGTFEGTVIT